VTETRIQIATRARLVLLLMGRNGAFLRRVGQWPKRAFLFHADEQFRNISFVPRGGHWGKPEETQNRIERLLAGPSLELFARRPRGALPPSTLSAGPSESSS
jgi:hypothetical protein